MEPPRPKTVYLGISAAGRQIAGMEGLFLLCLAYSICIPVASGLPVLKLGCTFSPFSHFESVEGKKKEHARAFICRWKSVVLIVDLYTVLFAWW